MKPKPVSLGPEYAAQFQDRSVAEAYRARPSYAAEVYSLLDGLRMGEGPVLELGAGTGDLTIGLADRVGPVDAVEPSAEMLRVARARVAESTPITWHHASAEAFKPTSRYSLAVAAESLHWMDWEVVLPLIWGACPMAAIWRSSIEPDPGQPERLCAWVAEPANAFTSLTKTVAGVAILVQAMAREVRDARLLIGVAALAQGPMGFSLHASGTFVGELLDVSGMFVLAGILLTFALGRLLYWSRARHVAFFFLMQTGCMGLLLAYRPIGITLFVLQLIAWAVVEILLARDGRTRSDYRGLRGMLLSLLIGFGFWELDKTGAWCDPQNHVINGHAIWHMLTSLTVWFFWVDQRDLPAMPPDRPERQ